MARLDTVNKNFEKDLDDIISLFNSGENFAFSRFSDGEVYMLQKKPIKMFSNGALVGDKQLPGAYSEDDWKDYNPDTDEFYRQKLEDAIKHKQDNYFKGLSCRCCIADGEKNFKWQLDLIGPGDEHNLTWSNLLINSNYLKYITNFVPLFKNKRIFSVINKNGDIPNWTLDFQPEKNFAIGPKCIQNDYEIIDEIKNYIKHNNIKDCVFICAASSLSNMIIHQCFSDYPNNTYIDVGSSLNPFIPGIGSRRAYMSQLSTGVVDGAGCIW
jgi:hypothetical protein